jgi:hypothetical protein
VVLADETIVDTIDDLDEAFDDDDDVDDEDEDDETVEPVDDVLAEDKADETADEADMNDEAGLLYVDLRGLETFLNSCCSCCCFAYGQVEVCGAGALD